MVAVSFIVGETRGPGENHRPVASDKRTCVLCSFQHYKFLMFFQILYPVISSLPTFVVIQRWQILALAGTGDRMLSFIL